MRLALNAALHSIILSSLILLFIISKVEKHKSNLINGANILMSSIEGQTKSSNVSKSSPHYSKLVNEEWRRIQQAENDMKRCYFAEKNQLYSCLTCKVWEYYDSLKSTSENVPYYSCITCPRNYSLVRVDFNHFSNPSVCCIENSINCKVCDRVKGTCLKCRK